MPNENTDSQVNIARIMIPKISVAAVHANDTVRQGLEIMKYHRYTSIPVLDGQDVYLGSVTEGDFLRHILATGTTEMKAHEKYRISEIFRPNYCAPLPIYASLQELSSRSLEQNYVPIVDGRGCLCGIVTRRALILHLNHTITGENE